LAGPLRLTITTETIERFAGVPDSGRPDGDSLLGRDFGVLIDWLPGGPT
jgi:hypothetical protein